MAQHRNVEKLMKGYPKEVILKDGTGVTLRPLIGGDERLLLEMFQRLSRDDLWFLNHELTGRDLIDEWVRNLDPDRVMSIVALLEGNIIANAALMMKRYGAKSHIGKVRISVDPAFREKGLGTWMLLDLVNMAMARGLRMLVMRLVQDRDVYIFKGVRRLDFIQEALLKDHVLDREGNPHNLIIMTKRLPVEWEA
jgi:GNAT superfamily N-acetyltransferase